MSLELVKDLFKKQPDLASLYISCVEDYNANMDDVRLVLSSLPKDLKFEVVQLYLLAEKQKTDPDDELSSKLQELQAKNPRKIEEIKQSFRPSYIHNLNRLAAEGLGLQKLDVALNQDWLSQYGNANLFKDKIVGLRADLLTKYKKQFEASIAEGKKAAERLKTFTTNAQSSHDNLVENSASTSFAKLQQSYPQCNINSNTEEIKQFLGNLSDKAVSKKNKDFASSLLREMYTNPNYQDAKIRLAYVWQAIKDGNKLSDRGAKATNIKQLQTNLQESVITQLAVIETNYSVESKNYAGAGRSCPGGTKNAIIQILDGYHQDVNFNVFGKKAPVLDADLAQTRFKELFLEDLSQLKPEERMKIIKNWDQASSIFRQTQLDNESRLAILNIVNRVEQKLLTEYSTSHYPWYSEHKKTIEQNASLDKASLSKPELDLIYEYKEVLKAKRFNYQQMIEATKKGGDLNYLSEFMQRIKAKGINVAEDMVQELIPNIKQKDLDSLREDILKAKYKTIEESFNSLDKEEKACAVSFSRADFIDAHLEDKNGILANHLREKFAKLATTEYDPILKTTFERGEHQTEIARAMFDGSIKDPEKAELGFLKSAYDIRKKQLSESLLSLKSIRHRTAELSEQIRDIAIQQNNSEEILADKYFQNIHELLKTKKIEDCKAVITELQSKDLDIFKLVCKKKDDNVNALLPFFIFNGYSEIAKALIDGGADLNVKHDYNGTALNLAALKGDSEIVKLLIEKGADLNVKHDYYGTALNLAVSRGKSEIAKLLIDGGADLNVKERFDNTLLHLAIDYGYSEIAKLLIEKGADLNVKNRNGNTALYLAASKDDSEIVKLLIEKGADPTIKNAENELPKGLQKDSEVIKFFKEAIKDGDLQLVIKLTEHYGEKLKGKYLSNISGRTLLSYANAKKPEIAAYLFKEGFIQQKTWGEYFKEMLIPKKAKEKDTSYNKLGEKTKEEYGKLLHKDVLKQLKGLEMHEGEHVKHLRKHHINTKPSQDRVK